MSKTTLRFSENPQASTRFRCRAAYGRRSRPYRSRARACLVWLRSLAWSGCSSRPAPTVHTHRRPAGGQGSQGRGLQTIVSEAANVVAQERSGEQKRMLTAGHDLLLQLRLASHERPWQRPTDPVACQRQIIRPSVTTGSSKSSKRGLHGPCEFWPRLHVRNAGPFVQFRTCMSVSPNCGDVSTWYCTSSWPVGATILSVRSNGRRQSRGQQSQPKPTVAALTVARERHPVDELLPGVPVVPDECVCSSDAVRVSETDSATNRESITILQLCVQTCVTCE